MTIAKRLTILLIVPLVALLGPGIFVRPQRSDVEDQNRFVAESQIEALAWETAVVSNSFGFECGNRFRQISI